MLLPAPQAQEYWISEKDQAPTRTTPSRYADSIDGTLDASEYYLNDVKSHKCAPIDGGPYPCMASLVLPS